MTDTLKAGERLNRGQELWSANGFHKLAMQHDGNLVLYGPRGAVWDTATYRLPDPLRPTHLAMQTDGNIVLYNDFGYVGWSPNIHGKSGDRLVMQDDQNLVVYRPDGTPVWATDTWIRPVSARGNEITQHKDTEVAWAKWLDTRATLYRNGTLTVTNKSRCDAPFSGLKGRILVLVIDAHSRVIWASQQMDCEVACALLDPSCGSSGTDTFTEHFPPLIGQLGVRIDILQADSAIYDRMRKAIRESLDVIKEIAPVLALWV